MADKLGISQGTLCKIENGFVDKVDFVLMNKICNFFKVDLQYFLEEDSFSQTNTNNKNSAISIFGNPTVNNNFPESILSDIQKIIDENKQLKEENTLLKKELKI